MWQMIQFSKGAHCLSGKIIEKSHLKVENFEKASGFAPEKNI